MARLSKEGVRDADEGDCHEGDRRGVADAARVRVSRAAVRQAGRAALDFAAMQKELSRRKSVRVGSDLWPS